MIENAEQKSLDWYRCRLGNITGSNVGLLMKNGKSGMFSDTAKNYIFQVAAERSMNPEIINDDIAFAEYLSTVNVESKAMRFGTEQESSARDLYSRLTGRHVVEVGSCKHPTIPSFASSPDGIFYDEETGEGDVEIKCPSQNTFMKYKSDVYDNDSLLQVKYEYFYQCMAHMMCTGAKCCDFVVYNPFQADPIHIVRILPDEKVFAEMEKRIRMADDIINQIADVE
ncbi:lambda exonuclease family protein [Bacteroides fragilis]|nr:YqaJ viral recombinase family protein [Bacteroides fragilis]